MPRTFALLLLVIAALALLPLVTGAAYLETTLPGGLPVGNALTAVALCAAAGSAVGLSAARTALRFVSIAALCGAVAWLPVSIALAGNLALNFDGARGSAWLALSAIIAVAVLGALAWALIAALLAGLRRARS